MMIKLIYVAGPYRGVTREAVLANIEAARHVGGLLMHKGWMPVIPHVNTGMMEDRYPWLRTDEGENFMLEGTLEIMRRCDAVCLVVGYEYSDGTKGEIAEAKRLGIKVYYDEIDVPDAEQHVPAIPKETVAIPRRPDELDLEKE